MTWQAKFSKFDTPDCHLCFIIGSESGQIKWHRDEIILICRHLRERRQLMIHAHDISHVSSRGKCMYSVQFCTGLIFCNFPEDVTTN